MAQEETAPAHGHHVQFYESSTRLAKRVAGYLREALDQTGAAIAVARRAHLSPIASELASEGLDPDDLVRMGRLQLINADGLLETLVVGDRIDPGRFDSLVGSLVRSASGGPLHVYGEMVDLLRAAGRASAVFELEALWGELLHERPFTLLCGYRLSAFEDDSLAFDRVVACHHGVTGTHRVAGAGADHATARTLAELEQRAHSLQFEIDRGSGLRAGSVAAACSTSR